MQSQPPQRRRGVLLTPAGLKKLKDAIRDSENRYNQGEKYTLEDLSQHTRLDGVTIARVLQAEVGVDKRTLERFFRALRLELAADDYTRQLPGGESEAIGEPRPSNRSRQQDLSEAVDVTTFYGREAELAQLKQWIIGDRCRLITILGIGGMGKTALSVKLAEQLGPQFESVIWKSLRNAPLLCDLLATLIQFFAAPADPGLPGTVEERIAQLFNLLRQNRHLIILDNIESILQSGSRTGRYREGYEAYGQLFRCIGETVHQSCLLLTSREKPRELAVLEGRNLPVQALQLRGLQSVEAQAILQAKGACAGTETEWRRLVDHYGGNPLALKMIAPAVQVFETVTEFLAFLQRGNLVFEDIRDLLNQQFERLSTLEREVMYWLAIHREPVSLSRLRSDPLPPLSERELLEAILTLDWRSLIERNGTQFTLQPVMMEYVIERLIEQICREITTQEIDILRRCAIVQATAADAVREAQTRFILDPIRDRLMEIFMTRNNLRNHLTQLLENLQIEPILEQGYASENLASLLQQL